MKSGVIVIEGCIGVGKSTFAKALSNCLDCHCEMEPDEETNPFLKDYYQNERRYAFTMQMYLLSRRWRAQLDAQAVARYENKFVVMDRSYYGDVCFANVQKDMHFFDSREYDTYMQHHEDMRKFLEPPSAVIHLKANIDTCQKRIARRASEKEGRKCESGISNDYLERLDSEICDLIQALRPNSNVLEIDWNKDKTEKEIEDVCLMIRSWLGELHWGNWWTGAGLREMRMDELLVEARRIAKICPRFDENRIAQENIRLKHFAAYEQN